MKFPVGFQLFSKKKEMRFGNFQKHERKRGKKIKSKIIGVGGKGKGLKSFRDERELNLVFPHGASNLHIPFTHFYNSKG